MTEQITDVELSKEAQRLYLNYALSVITARALPDVRDGLKPVQRRILYSMHHELHLRPDGKPAKCARIVGDVIGKYHPHGDTAVYDALVRMTQEWVMRAPLVKGQGNFGSQDGDAPAAYRYTEAKLHPIAMELLVELAKKVVEYRPTFDSVKTEPIVLPARFPNLLVNGAQGIAVGMATSIPPHNLGEVTDALIAMVDDPDISLAGVMKKIKGPDFPTGGELISPRADIKAIYKTGGGSLKLRGTWKSEKSKTKQQIIITSIPYALEKSSLVEKIAEVIIKKKLPALVDVRDESTDTTRVVLELKKGTNPDLVMAYLAKNTPFQSNVQVNLTCLIPTDNPEITAPRKLSLTELLSQFLEFRQDIVKKRIQFDLDELERRLHILEGFEKVFDALDEIIRIIRRSEGKADAAKKIIKKFDLDEIQTDAILELKLYKLAKLEILLVREEADKKRKEATRLRGLLRSPAKRWALIKAELQEIKDQYGDKRRTRIVADDQATEFSEEDFIVDEEAFVIVTANGWVKRQGSVKDLKTSRIKDGDRILACVAGSTRSTVGFFSSRGHCYVSRIADIPASTGYGDPLQKLFKFDDGERVVGALSFDPRFQEFGEEEEFYEDGSPVEPYALAVTRQGFALRFPLFGHKEPSNRNGRKFSRLKEGDEVVTVFATQGFEYVVAATDDGHALAVDIEETALLSSAGRGTMLIKVAPKASVIAAVPVESPRVGSLVVRTDKGKKYELFAESLITTRGGRGKAVVKRSKFKDVEYQLPEVPSLDNDDDEVAR